MVLRVLGVVVESGFASLLLVTSPEGVEVAVGLSRSEGVVALFGGKTSSSPPPRRPNPALNCFIPALIAIISREGRRTSFGSGAAALSIGFHAAPGGPKGRGSSPRAAFPKPRALLPAAVKAPPGGAAAAAAAAAAVPAAVPLKCPRLQQEQSPSSSLLSWATSVAHLCCAPLLLPAPSSSSSPWLVEDLGARSLGSKRHTTPATATRKSTAPTTLPAIIPTTLLGGGVGD